MAPEQMVGGDIGPPADVFSLGAILFEILAGEPLHPHGPEAIASTLARPGDSPTRRAPDRSIAPELDAVCIAALANDPTDRPSARELAHRVQSYLDGDRDLERRRALARQQLEIARAALADPARRSEAGQAASRALALDPESPDAAQLLAQMILEPPSELPRELVASLEASERELNRQRTRPAAYAYLSLFFFVPVFLILRNVENVFDLVLLYVAATAMAVLLLYNGKRWRTPVWLFLLANFTFALMFMRLAGLFVLSAALVSGQALGLASRSRVAERPWLLVGWIAVTMLLPFALEYFGVLPRTWWMNPDGVLTRGTILHTGRDVDVVFLAISQAVLVMVVGFFSLSITRARETAQRNAHIQAWHLHQLVPRATVSSRALP
jgi:serine/threonine-protein kinase